MGHSAGGDIATKKTLTTNEFKADWLPASLAAQDSRVALGVSISAPYDFDRWVNDKGADRELTPVPALQRLLDGKPYSVLDSEQYADEHDPVLIVLHSSNDPIIPLTGQKAALLRMTEKAPIVYLLSPVDAHNAAFGFSADTVNDSIFALAG